MNIQTQEALKMAIEVMYRNSPKIGLTQELEEAINACKEALEQPAWQGLTDNEKLANIRKWAENNTIRGQELIGLCDAIEQALKEKNDKG